MADEQSAHAPLDRGVLERLRRLAGFVLADQRVPLGMELSLLALDAEPMAQLNAQHMSAEGPTDVLAFPIDLPGETRPEDGTPILGDVVVCPAVAAEQAARNGVSLVSELELLVVHGILHLLGHDHAQDEERAVMFGLTDRLLEEFRAREAAA